MVADFRAIRERNNGLRIQRRRGSEAFKTKRVTARTAGIDARCQVSPCDQLCRVNLRTRELASTSHGNREETRTRPIWDGEQQRVRTHLYYWNHIWMYGTCKFLQLYAKRWRSPLGYWLSGGKDMDVIVQKQEYQELRIVPATKRNRKTWTVNTVRLNLI